MQDLHNCVQLHYNTATLPYVTILAERSMLMKNTVYLNNDDFKKQNVDHF